MRRWSVCAFDIFLIYHLSLISASTTHSYPVSYRLHIRNQNQLPQDGNVHSLHCTLYVFTETRVDNCVCFYRRFPAQQWAAAPPNDLSHPISPCTSRLVPTSFPPTPVKDTNVCADAPARLPNAYLVIIIILHFYDNGGRSPLSPSSLSSLPQYLLFLPFAFAFPLEPFVSFLLPFGPQV